MRLKAIAIALGMVVGTVLFFVGYGLLHPKAEAATCTTNDECLALACADGRYGNRATICL